MSVQQKPFKSSWVDSVPAHWEQLRLGRMARIYAGGTPDKANAAFWGGDIPWLNSGTVNQWMITEPSEYITEQGYEGSSARWVPKGALVMALAGQGKTKGMCAQLAIDATCNQSMAAILPDFGVSRYLLYWLSANYRNIRGMASDDLRDGLNLVLLGQIPVPVPPTAEQEAIAAYLDTETARIDMLLAEKGRLIETLREYRQATISEVITQGLDPAAPKKPSGVPWLGEIPAHWSIEKLKFLVRFVGGGTPSKDNDEYWGGDIPWVSPKDMKRPRIDDTEDKITEDAVGSSACTMIATGAVLVVVRSGILQHTIPIAINDVPVAVNQDMKALIPEERVQSSFLAYQIQGCQRELREDWVKQGATVESVEQQRMADSRFAIPPPDEQEAIASYLDRETARIDKLVDHVQDEIKLLQELRAATIADAVLGRIDVRTLSPQH